MKGSTKYVILLFLAIPFFVPMFRQTAAQEPIQHSPEWADFLNDPDPTGVDIPSFKPRARTGFLLWCRKGHGGQWQQRGFYPPHDKKTLTEDLFGCLKAGENVQITELPP